MTLDKAFACQSNTLLVGVDGGASGFRAHEIVVQPTANGLRLALGEHSAAESIEDPPGFVPLSFEAQHEQALAKQYTVSDAEQVLQARWIHAASRAIRRVASSCNCERIWVGVCTPGLKTEDGRGIGVCLNGPRSPVFSDALEQALSLDGLHLAEPLGRLHSDAVACAMGESLAEGGLLADVEHAYYIGGGSGVAEAFRLRGRVLAADELLPQLPRAWQALAEDGRSYEVQLSARGINRDFRERASADAGALLSEHAAAAGDARACELFLERSRHLAQWCFLRLMALHETQRIALERIVIGQRLGQLFLDPRLAACFSQPTRAHLYALLKDGAPQELRAIWLRDGQLASGCLLGSGLRAAPALGALAMSITQDACA